tara:strand:- start:359 stop:859 length:501 start_codon:yes stop_codon:yes gene_type:complete
MGTIKADTVTGLADPNKATIPNTITMGSTTATLNFGNTAIANASAGSTTITGEGGSNTTNIQQGLCKAWIALDGTASGATERDSFNVASTDDDGTGIYGVNFTTNMGNANYPALAQRAVLTGGETTGTGNCNRMTTSSIDKVQAYDDAGSLGDRDNITCHVVADLA